MLPRNIDLTEHRDFNSNNGRPINQFRIRQYINGLPDMDVPMMTLSDFVKIQWWEKIFGRRCHHTEKERIFNYEAKHEQYWKETCVRCGRPLRRPWVDYGNVCQQCDQQIEGNRVPWKKYYIPVERPRFSELFDLR